MANQGKNTFVNKLIVRNRMVTFKTATPEVSINHGNKKNRR